MPVAGAGAALVLDFGAGKVLNVDPVTGNSSVLAGPIANSALNALTFDRAGTTTASVSSSEAFDRTNVKSVPTPS